MKILKYLNKQWIFNSILLKTAAFLALVSVTLKILVVEKLLLWNRSIEGNIISCVFLFNYIIFYIIPITLILFFLYTIIFHCRRSLYTYHLIEFLITIICFYLEHKLISSGLILLFD